MFLCNMEIFLSLGFNQILPVPDLMQLSFVFFFFQTFWAEHSPSTFGHREHSEVSDISWHGHADHTAVSPCNRGSKASASPHHDAGYCFLTAAWKTKWMLIENGEIIALIFCFPQKPIFSPVTPVAAATVAPIVATNTVPSTTTIGMNIDKLVENVCNVWLKKQSSKLCRYSDTDIDNLVFFMLRYCPTYPNDQ